MARKKTADLDQTELERKVGLDLRYAREERDFLAAQRRLHRSLKLAYRMLDFGVEMVQRGVETGDAALAARGAFAAAKGEMISRQASGRLDDAARISAQNREHGRTPKPNAD